METASEIKSAVNNIRYYSHKIYQLGRKQLNSDVEVGNRIGININSGSIRFDTLGAIGSACNQIDLYCDNIEANLKSAIEQDKLLNIEEDDEDGG